MARNNLREVGDLNDCLFCKIARKEIPADIVYEDDDVLAFRDIRPQAPVHVLVIPKRHIASLADLTQEDKDVMGHVTLVASRLARDLGVSEGYRVVINCGKDAGQSVFHIHMHLLGGRSLGWPPG
ncbi:MAG: histidine triad nucleotide-binding protein [Bacillota bacterium]|jgi:histidine triad (HIT) family protein|nr:histidine triad nucleotide-binding protein [Bacillota bacterium]HOB88348.1 histidine triad nucleotide-binding protein [Bacillota bacterium]HPU60927.1 histidine triad nucleotide-binding protein [Bacillota bacterium]HPZ91861.1 histidine triad nucleotide-binding protein [Bacillota bacterium]HQE03120.1 histidine triad nucleotide-binding protein [Bacillota bacterium]